MPEWGWHESDANIGILNKHLYAVNLNVGTVFLDTNSTMMSHGLSKDIRSMVCELEKTLEVGALSVIAVEHIDVAPVEPSPIPTLPLPHTREEDMPW